MLSLHFVDEEIRFREHKRDSKVMEWLVLPGTLSTCPVLFSRVPSRTTALIRKAEMELSLQCLLKLTECRRRICQEEARCAASSGLSNVHMAYFCTGPRRVSSG